jgi:hypothetical protein
VAQGDDRRGSGNVYNEPTTEEKGRTNVAKDDGTQAVGGNEISGANTNIPLLIVLHANREDSLPIGNCHFRSDLRENAGSENLGLSHLNVHPFCVLSEVRDRGKSSMERSCVAKWSCWATNMEKSHV